MTGILNRRDFLATAGVGAVATMAGTTPAIEPIKRTGKPQFHLSMAAYSYRQWLTGAKPKLTLYDFVDDCVALGLDGTELTSYYFPQGVTDDYLRALKQHCFRQGIEVSGTAVGNDFCHPPGPARDQQLAAMKAWIDRAAVLGAPVIRIFSGNAKQGQSTADAHKLAVEAMETSCEYAGKRGVFLALENHGGLTARPEGLLALVKDVKSPWFGVNLDTGNFHGEDVYADLAQLAPYAVNVQVKVVVRSAGKPAAQADFARLAKMLRDVGYRGYVALEFEEKGDPREECRRYLGLMREAFG